MDHGKEMKVWLYALLSVAGIVLAITGIAVSQTAKVKSPANQVANSKGKNLFESSCAVCHGLDGGGGEHAPSIGRLSAAKSKSDADLARILRDGIPNKGMPPFRSLGDIQLSSVLSYLRSLQAKNDIRADVGNPVHGKQLFFGKGQCADCHAMHDQGSFLSTDLSDFAYDHDPNDIHTAITNPEQVVPHTLARVATSTGQQFSGVVRNEDNSSLQIQDSDGQFYLLMKLDLRSTERSPAPYMPRDYQQKLSASEIDDLVSYIIQQSPKSEAAVNESARRKKENRME